MVHTYFWKIFYALVAAMSTLGTMAMVIALMVMFTKEDYLVVLLIGIGTGYLVGILWALGWPESKKRRVRG